MNKKKIIILTVLVLIIALAAVVCLTSVPKSLIDNRNNAVVPVDTVSDNEMYKPKPIPLEMMNDWEKETVNISTTTYRRIQVLQRNDDGSVAVYRIINSNADIVTEY